MTDTSSARPVTGRTAERDAEGDEVVGVPWLGVVLPLALLLALLDDFWVVSLRTSVGAIERTSEPFASWLRESTVVLPLYVLVVVAALAVDRRWSGRPVRGFPPLVVTVLLVAAAATGAGVVGLAASAAYDYHLQELALIHQSVNHGACLGDCLAGRNDESFDLQVKAVTYGSALLLATNLLAVGWVAALRGGRLEPGARRAVRDDGHLASRPATRADDAARVLAAALVGAAVVHAAVVPEHLAEWPAAGRFLVALTGIEVLAAVLVRQRGRGQLLLAGAVSLGPLVVWAWSRTVGLPFGPDPGAAEPVGLADVAAVLLEVVALALAVALARGGGRLTARPARSAHARAMVLAAVVTVAFLGVAGSSLTGVGIVPGGPEHRAASAPPGA